MPDNPDGVIKRSIMIARHRTSVSMEALFWDQLGLIARTEGTSVAALILRIDGSRKRQNLSSAIRLFVLTQALSTAATAPPEA